jgi:peptide/nickel transport system permease protein
MMYFIPGDPVAMMPGSAQPRADPAVRDELGLNDPYLIRLGKFIGAIFLHFDFGESWFITPRSQRNCCTGYPARLPSLFCILLQIFLGIPLGIIAVVKQDSWIDRTAMFALFGISMPNFWIALMLVLFSR